MKRGHPSRFFLKRVKRQGESPNFILVQKMEYLLTLTKGIFLIFKPTFPTTFSDTLVLVICMGEHGDGRAVVV